MIWIFAAILWFGLLTLQAPGRWWLSAFEISLFVVGGWLIWQRRGALRFHPIGLILAAAAFWGILQIGFHRTVDVQHTLEAALHWVTNCAAFSIAVAITGDPPRRQRLLTAQIIFALLLSIAAIFGATSFASRNQFAAYVEPMLALAITAAMWDRPRTVMWLAIAAALFASVVATGSRAGVALCLAELAVLPLAAFARGGISGRALARVAALSAAIMIAVTAVVGWEAMLLRFQEPHPYFLRADLARSSIAMFQDRPLMGFGLGTWSDAYPGYARFDDGLFANQAHNDWAQWATEGGAPFFLLILAIPVLLLRPALRSLWGLGLLAVFVHALVDYPMQQRPALAAYFFALAGALVSERASGPER